MERVNINKISKTGLGLFINRVQTLFVSLLRIWTIPIVLMLSIASGFTTYYGMSHFIIPWIALIITIAIQSIIVICSLEIAGIHWKANRFRYFSILLSLLIALAASISFSYFKFYEISERETLYIQKFKEVRQEVDNYLDAVLASKVNILQQQREELDKLSQEVSQAYFGTHPEIPPQFKNQVGEGPFWADYNKRYQTKKKEFEQLEKEFALLDEQVKQVQTNLNHLNMNSGDIEAAYQQIVSSLQNVQLKFTQLATRVGDVVPEAPVLMPYAQFSRDVVPSFSMWEGFSLFAFICAAMVDFFTVLLSYRLEFSAPGPLTEEEEELIFECLRQFTEFRINANDELEMIIEKTPIEKARGYSDWARMFAVGFLLSRGFLRKIDERTVEFAPNLYPMVAERMGDKLRALKALAKQDPQPETKSKSEPNAELVESEESYE
jgi:hypothetical protein